jgi:fatty acid desaturase
MTDIFGMGAIKLEENSEVGVVEKQEILAFLKRRGNEALMASFLKLNRVSNTKAAWSITRQWFSIITAIAFAKFLGTWWSYAVAIIVISTRQHALGIIMHEATHWRLFSNKWSNDFFGNTLCAFPLNMVVSRYRSEHLPHHRYNMTDEDPYKREWTEDPHWHWPKTKGQVFWLFFKDLLNLNMGHLGPTLFRWSPWANHFSTKSAPQILTRTERLSLYGFIFTVGTTVVLTNTAVDLLLLWMLPMSTLTVIYVRARSSVEHINLPCTHEFNSTRHVDANLLEKLTIAPLNINIHIAHHLFPGVPQYNLPAFHQLLLHYPKYKQESRIYDSYFGSGKRAFDEMFVNPK